MATSTPEKFPYCGAIAGELSACPLLAQVLGLMGQQRALSPHSRVQTPPCWGCCLFSANRAGQGLARTNHIKPGDTFYYLAAGLSSVLKLSLKQDSHSGLFADWEVQIEKGGCCK